MLYSRLTTCRVLFSLRTKCVTDDSFHCTLYHSHVSNCLFFSTRSYARTRLECVLLSVSCWSTWHKVRQINKKTYRGHEGWRGPFVWRIHHITPTCKDTRCQENLTFLVTPALYVSLSSFISPSLDFTVFFSAFLSFIHFKVTLITRASHFCLFSSLFFIRFCPCSLSLDWSKCVLCLQVSAWFLFFSFTCSLNFFLWERERESYFLFASPCHMIRRKHVKGESKSVLLSRCAWVLGVKERAKCFAVLQSIQFGCHWLVYLSLWMAFSLNAKRRESFVLCNSHSFTKRLARGVGHMLQLSLGRKMRPRRARRWNILMTGKDGWEWNCFYFHESQLVLAQPNTLWFLVQVHPSSATK